MVYPAAEARRGAGRPSYDLNLNAGPSREPHVSFDAAEEPAHWFVLDLAVVRTAGVRLQGPPPERAFGDPGRPVLLQALVESIAWHAHSPQARWDDVVLNACRAWRFAVEGIWNAKDEAGRWALQRGAPADLVQAALAARAGQAAGRPDAAALAAFGAQVTARLRAATQAGA